MNLAQAADRYVAQTVGRTLFHAAGFGRTREQAARALAVVQLVHGVKGCQIHAGGQVLADWVRVESVLKCFLQASGCDDPRGHCVVVVDEATLVAAGGGVREPVAARIGPRPAPAAGLGWVESIGRRAFPCRFLLHRNFRFQPDHPAGEPAQLQAAAVREGCDWCPQFNHRGEGSDVVES